MDWEVVAQQTRWFDALSAQERSQFLADLAQDASEEARETQRYVERLALATSFMSTRTPDAVQATALDVGARVGVWRVTGLLGAGGMGEVYKAERADGLYEQTVAVKVLRSTDGQLAARFERERQRLARMDHPGVSRIIDGGTLDDGLAFMTMEFVDGSPIDAHVNGLALEETLR
ncbi:MAG: protein kinase, partial [Pseudomonadota bacterium]